MIAIRDAHTHFFSRVYFETLAKSATGEAATGERLEELARTAGVEIPSADAMALQERWLQHMDDAGIETLVTFASVPEEAEVVAEVAATSGGRMIGYTAVNLAAPGAPAFIDRALGELGLRGVVLFPALHHYSPSDEACRPALERIEAAGGVCVVHCGMLRMRVRELLGHPRAYDARFASPLGLVRAAGEHSGIPFVIPHFGGGLLAETLLAAAWCANILVDTSSSNDWMNTHFPRLTLSDVLGRALEVLGPRRILFGSDSSSFPRGYRQDVLEAQVSALDAIGASTDERELILGGNFDRLLRAAAG